MSNLLGEAILRLDLKHGEFIAGANKVNMSLRTITQTAIGTALGFSGGMGLAAAVSKTTQAVVGSVKELAVYGKGMKEVSTLVDTTKVNMDNLSRRIDFLSSKWGRGQGGLSAALYEAISANVEASKSTQFLDTAIKSAVGGVTDAKTTVDGLTSVMNAYGLSVDDAESVSDALFTTVRDGKTKFDELANSIGNVSPMAASLDINIDTLGSSIAALTLSGQSTSEAVTGLRGVFTAILKPSKDAQEVAKMLGIELSASAVKSKGFAEFMEEVRQKTAGSQAALAKLFPDVQGLNAVMQLTSDQGAKNFNRILDDMRDKAGKTTEAAEKMKDTLSFKWDKAVQDTKLFGQDIAKYLQGPLEAVLDAYNRIGDRAAKARAGEIQGSIKTRFQIDPNLTSDEEIATLLKEQEARIEKNKAYIEANEFGAEFEKSEVKEAELLIEKINEVIKLRYVQSGINKREADMAREAEIEAEQRAAAQAERDKKEREEKAKKIESDLKARDEQKKNAEIAEKNATLLTKLEEDRLAIASRTAGMVEQNNQMQINGKREAAEAIRKYDKLVYESQAEQLEAIASDENRSIEERKKASDDLHRIKIKNAENEKDYKLQLLKIESEAEILQNDQRIRAIDEYWKELEQTYKENYKKVSDSSIANKKEILANIEDEHNKRKESLDFMRANNEKTFRQIEQRGELAARNIDQEFKNTLQSDAVYKIKADIELGLKDLFDNDSDSIFNGLIEQYNNLKEAFESGNFSSETSKSIDKEMRKVKMQIVSEAASMVKSATSTALDTITAETKDRARIIMTGVGDMLSEIGDKTDNVFSKVAGEALGIVGSFVGFILSSHNRIKEVEAKNQAVFEAIKKSVDSTIVKTQEWLFEIGKADTSNMSLSQLESQQYEIYKSGAASVGSGIGATISPEQFKNLYTLMQKGAWTSELGKIREGKTYDQYINSKPDWVLEDEIYGPKVFTKDEFSALEQINKQTKDKNVWTFSNKLQDLVFEYSEAIESSQKKIDTYDKSSGLNYVESKTKDDFLQDIETMRSTGKISELQYYKDLYEYSHGIKSHPYDAWKWFGIAERETYKKQYEDFKNGANGQQTMGIIGLASGGIVMSPTTANIAEMGKPEAVIPLDRLPEIASMFNRGQQSVGQIIIENRIDPNIPITQNTARQYSEQIGEAVRNALRARGN